MRSKRIRGCLTVLALSLGVAFVIQMPKVAASSSNAPRQEVTDDTMIPEGIYVGKHSLGGMTKAEAEQLIADYIAGLSSQQIVLSVDGNEITTSAAELGFQWKNTDAVEKAANVYKGGNLVKRYTALKDLQYNNVIIELETTLEDGAIAGFVEEQCKPFIQPAKDATLTRSEGRFIVTPSAVGREVDIEATKAALTEALNSGSEGSIRVEAVVAVKQPNRTEEALSAVKNVLGTYTTTFNSGNSARTKNLKTGTSKINGRVLMPGEILSGYECMQPFTQNNGYATAASYANGAVVDSVGGGACQIATTLYNAAILAEVEITQRQNHSMTVGYVDNSFDAAIAGTYKDIKFKNNYDHPIYVEGTVSGNKLSFTIFGKETRSSNRTIKYVSETLSTTYPEGEIVTVDPSLAPGAQVVDQQAYPGVKSKLWKYVYIDGVQTEKTLINSDSYSAAQQRRRVGPEAPAVPADTPPMPENETPPVPENETPVSVPEEAPPEAVEGVNGGPGVTAPAEN